MSRSSAWRRVRRVLVALYIGINLAIVPATITFGEHRADWQTFLAVREALPSADIYSLDTLIPFVWSPAAAWVMAGVTHLGYWPWVGVHIAVLALLRFSPLLLVLMASSWAFWIDVAQGNILTFVVIAAILAMRGSRAAALISVVLFLFMPRPLQLPLVAWLLWTMPSIRWPAAVLFVIHTAFVIGGGYAQPWIDAVLAWSQHAVGIGPTRLVGLAWLWVGVPLAAWLTYRGRVGWAGMAMSTYVLPQYLLMPLVDLVRPAAGREPATEGPTTHGTRATPAADRDELPGPS